ncbi:MAG TPA: hypothetical protein VL175_12590 [Pirellulales bacterium]|jgi:hypothetical protein|nr:hypothetical protein [Pirellulales bacterium]
MKQTADIADGEWPAAWLGLAEAPDHHRAGIVGSAMSQITILVGYSSIG